MKTLSNALRGHLAGDTTLATLVKITRGDGVVVALTTFDADLVVGGVTYKADGSFSAEKVESQTALKATDDHVVGLLDSGLISEKDLSEGRFDHARVDVALCNWADLTQGVVPVRRGWLGEVTRKRGRFVAELRGLQDLLQRRVGRLYTPECARDLGDTGCGVVAAPVTGCVTAVTDSVRFVDRANAAADGVFAYGRLTWVSGVNQGLVMDVKAWTAASFTMTLWLPMPNPVAVGDAYSVVAGCDKKFATCCARFNNAANFGGFPHLPGLSKILDYPESS